jgi:hypothetical protein
MPTPSLSSTEPSPPPSSSALNRGAWRFYLGLAIVAVIGAVIVTLLDPFSHEQAIHNPALASPALDPAMGGPERETLLDH